MLIALSHVLNSFKTVAIKKCQKICTTFHLKYIGNASFEENGDLTEAKYFCKIFNKSNKLFLGLKENILNIDTYLTIFAHR